tara:strand:+ start:62 stop:523 length:462 start_codon:yes stop_codon:yes gene_type:complete
LRYYFIKTKHYKLISLLFDSAYQRYNKKLVNIIAVNIDANIPNDKVIEKPLIGPEPNINNNKAAIKVVIFASKIVEIALSKPFLIADKVLLLFLYSSLILSKIKTFASTAIPIVKTIPAIPGNVNVAPIVPNKDIIINRFAISEILANKPNKP